MEIEKDPFTGKDCYITYVKCHCMCHTNPVIIHFVPCCENGKIKIYTPIKKP